MTWNDIFMNFCIMLRNRSLCLKYKTSCIITYGTQIISIGYNGTLSGKIECSEYWTQYWEKNITDITLENWLKTDEFKNLHSKWSCINEIHAEINALNWISKRNITNSYAIYTYYSPCEQCAKSILSYGIKTLYYHKLYSGRTRSDENVLEYLKNNGINCIQLN